MNGVQGLLIVVTAYVDQTGRTLMHQLREHKLALKIANHMMSALVEQTGQMLKSLMPTPPPTVLQPRKLAHPQTTPSPRE